MPGLPAIRLDHSNCSGDGFLGWQHNARWHNFRRRQGAESSHRGRHTMVESLIAWLIVGAIAGWLAGLIVKGFGFGLIGNIVVGIIGAVIAGWLLPRLGIGLGTGMVAAIINAVIGAVVLLVIIGLVRRAT